MIMFHQPWKILHFSDFSWALIKGINWIDCNVINILLCIIYVIATLNSPVRFFEHIRDHRLAICMFVYICAIFNIYLLYLNIIIIKFEILFAYYYLNFTQLASHLFIQWATAWLYFHLFHLLSVTWNNKFSFSNRRPIHLTNEWRRRKKARRRGAKKNGFRIM